MHRDPNIEFVNVTLDNTQANEESPKLTGSVIFIPGRKRLWA